MYSIEICDIRRIESFIDHHELSIPNLNSGLLTSLVITLVTLGVLSFSIIELFSHKVTAYSGVRKILAAICLVIGVREAMQISRFGNFPPLALYYALGSGITSALLLIFAAAVATGIYLNATTADLRGLLVIIRKNTKHALVIGAGLAYLAFITAFLVTRPYHIGTISSLYGNSLDSVLFDRYYQFLRLPVFVLLVGYIVPLIYLAARRTQDRELRRSLNVVWASWAGIGALLVFTAVSQNLEKIDLNGPTFLIMAVVFSLGAIGFNRASLLVGFTDYKQQPMLGNVAVHPFSRRLKISDSISGKMFLLESKVGVEFAATVRDFCIEQLAAGDKVFVITNIVSSVYKTLSKYHDIRFCLFSEKVRRPTLKESQNEILIPQDGVSTILYVIEKFTSPQEKVTLVFDNLTDIFITLGQDDGIKFLKSASEFIAEVGATALFIIYPEALDTMLLNWVRTMFGNILTVSEAGLKPLKEEG